MLGISSDSRFYSSIHTCAFYFAIPNPLFLSLWCFQIHRSLVIDSWFMIALVHWSFGPLFIIDPLWLIRHYRPLVLDSSKYLSPFDSCVIICSWSLWFKWLKVIDRFVDQICVLGEIHSKSKFSSHSIHSHFIQIIDIHSFIRIQHSLQKKEK